MDSFERKREKKENERSSGRAGEVTESFLEKTDLSLSLRLSFS